jgi:hypothetical protein
MNRNEIAVTALGLIVTFFMPWPAAEVSPESRVAAQAQSAPMTCVDDRAIEVAAPVARQRAIQSCAAAVGLPDRS